MPFSRRTRKENFPQRPATPLRKPPRLSSEQSHAKARNTKKPKSR